MLRTVLLPLALVASLGAPPAASASSLVNIQTVPYHPSDLRKDEGVRRLERLVARVVYRVCNGAVRRPLNEQAAYRLCMDAATADSRAQIDEAVRSARTSAMAQASGE
jgi:UrcA family protein